MTKILKKPFQSNIPPKNKPPLDTLAIVSPKSSDGQKSYENKQLAKAITLGQLFPLIDLDSPLNKSYWQTYHCNNVILQEGEKMTTTYCNGRWCTVCNRIRMAKMINGYSLPLFKLNNIHFVTLTAPNVEAQELKSEVDRMLGTWRKIYKHIKKYHKHIPLRGMRKLECTYNVGTGFNPHFHLIIEGKEMADIIMGQWMKHNPTAKSGGQDIRKADENSLLELFKYAVKGVHKGKFYPVAVDNIYQALYYRKTYYPIGIKKTIEENIDGIQSQSITFKGARDEVWKWDNDVKDWVSSEGELLTGCIIDGKLPDWIEQLTTKEKETAPESLNERWTKDIRQGLETIAADR